MSFWTPDRVQKLRRLAGRGLSAAQIAGLIGATRNAVIGRLSRTAVTLGQSRDPYAPWTPEGVAELRRLLGEGRTAKQIGHALGRSAAAINRQKTLLGLHSKAPMRRDGSWQAKRQKPTSGRPTGPANPPWEPPAPDAPGPNATTLIEAGPEHCRWPYGEPAWDMPVCGDPIHDDGPYCRAHARRARA